MDINLRALLTVSGGLITWMLLALIKKAQNWNLRNDASKSIKDLMQDKSEMKHVFSEYKEVEVYVDKKHEKIPFSHAIIENGLHPLIIVCFLGAGEMILEAIEGTKSLTSSSLFYFFYTLIIVIFTFGHELFFTNSRNSKSFFYLLLILLLWYFEYQFLTRIL